MRATNPFLISVGIHLTLFALVIGALSVLHKTMPMPSEKIKLKILMQPDEATLSTPAIQPPQPSPKTLEPTPTPKATEPRVVTPLAPRVVTENKPIIPSVQHTIPAPVPIPVTKTPDVIPVATPKTPPPTPVKEEYKYPHKETVDSILSRKIKCTREMNRFSLRGTVILSFDLTQNGEAINIKIDESSGSERLDHAVEQQIKSIAPMFPKPDETVSFRKNEFEFKGCGN
ncbi:MULTISPECIES: TonB family protein [unclassified Sulfuricurvum]|uniref:TonB family protein n=1 Tax=unclassified Sulfuricurvum TaxID=2632390 RepID=UPI00059B7833|nr:MULTISPECIES: TonB family protein [unclassified Sulfuricurvum]HBM34841.1 TonB family protein [Sulfuricurvum sp.]